MAGKYQKNRIQHKGSLRVCLLLVLILLASGGIGTTVAKYIHSTDGKMLVKAPEFYFTSDLLTEDGNVSYMLNSNTTQVQFLLRSTADELRNSDMKIGYTVSLEKPQDASGYLDITEGELTGTEKTKTVTLRDVQPGVTYTVTAIGEAGYTQELSPELSREWSQGLSPELSREQSQEWFPRWFPQPPQTPLPLHTRRAQSSGPLPESAGGKCSLYNVSGSNR